MSTHHDLQVAIEAERRRVREKRLSHQRNFDRYLRRFERHPPAPPNRAARRAAWFGRHIEQPFSQTPEKQASMIERLKALIFPVLPAKLPKSPKQLYVQKQEDNRFLLREIRNIDRRLLREIRRSKHYQTKAQS